MTKQTIARQLESVLRRRLPKLWGGENENPISNNPPSIAIWSTPPAPFGHPKRHPRHDQDRESRGARSGQQRPQPDMQAAVTPWL
jgi:hypothetical protein